MEDLNTCADEKFQPLRRALLDQPLKSLDMCGGKSALVTLKYDSTVHDALTCLAENKILAAPVFDDDKKFHGVCDMMMLVRYIARLSQGETDPSLPAYVESSDACKNTTLRDLTHGYKTSGRRILGEYDVPIKASQSVFSAITRMAEAGTHHLCVADDDGNVIDMVSQTKMIDFLSQHISAEMSTTRVSDIRPYTFLAQIATTAKAATAFLLIDSRGTSLNSLAVVEQPSGKLVDCISTSDLKHLLPTSERWTKLWSTVVDFKADVRKTNANVPATPVVVTTSSTLADVLRLMREQHTHRVFVVTSKTEMLPLDVVTMTDVIRFVCDKTRSKAQWSAWW